MILTLPTFKAIYHSSTHHQIYTERPYFILHTGYDTDGQFSIELYALLLFESGQNTKIPLSCHHHIFGPKDMKKKRRIRSTFKTMCLSQSKLFIFILKNITFQGSMHKIIETRSHSNLFSNIFSYKTKQKKGIFCSKLCHKILIWVHSCVSYTQFSYSAKTYETLSCMNMILTVWFVWIGLGRHHHTFIFVQCKRIQFIKLLILSSQ